MALAIRRKVAQVSYIKFSLSEHQAILIRDTFQQKR